MATGPSLSNPAGAFTVTSQILDQARPAGRWQAAIGADAAHHPVELVVDALLMRVRLLERIRRLCALAVEVEAVGVFAGDFDQARIGHAGRVGIDVVLAVAAGHDQRHPGLLQPALARKILERGLDLVMGMPGGGKVAAIEIDCRQVQPVRAVGLAVGIIRIVEIADDVAAGLRPRLAGEQAGRGHQTETQFPRNPRPNHCEPPRGAIVAPAGERDPSALLTLAQHSTGKLADCHAAHQSVSSSMHYARMSAQPSHSIVVDVPRI
jgi:hypothetical protein